MVLAFRAQIPENPSHKKPVERFSRGPLPCYPQKCGFDARPPRVRLDHRALWPNGTSQEAPLGEAEHGVASDDQMIEQTHVNQREAFP